MSKPLNPLAISKLGEITKLDSTKNTITLDQFMKIADYQAAEYGSPITTASFDTLPPVETAAGPKKRYDRKSVLDLTRDFITAHISAKGLPESPQGAENVINRSIELAKTFIDKLEL